MKITIVTKSGRVYEESGERLVSILNDKRDWYGIYSYTEYDPYHYSGEARYRERELLLQVNAMEIECIDYREEDNKERERKDI